MLPSHSSPAQIVVTTGDTGALKVVAVRVDDTTSTVQLQGELDLSTAELVSAALDNQLARGHLFVRLDLSRLSFMDCAGLRVFLHAHNEFLNAGGALVLTGLQPRILRLLSITQLEETLFVAEPHDLSRLPRVATALPAKTAS